MSNIRYLITFTVWLFGLGFSHAAMAQTTDWMTGKEAFPYAEQLKSVGLIVNNMECRDSGQRSLDVGSALVRMHFTQNTNGVDWAIDGWTHLEANKKFWAERGYRLASYTTFTRQKSGLKLYCTVYHK